IPLTTMYKMMPPKASVMIKAEARTSVKKTFCLKYRQLMELCFSFFICLHLQRRGTGLTEFVRYVIGDQIKRQGQTEQDHADGKKRLIVGAAIRRLPHFRSDACRHRPDRIEQALRNSRRASRYHQNHHGLADGP